jgi:hypothetical protein
MIKRLAGPLSAILILVGFSCGVWVQSAAPQETPPQTELQGPEGPIGPVGSTTVVTFQGKIVDVDTGRQLVTLEGPQGRRVTVWVRNPDNLKGVKVGDPFAARFYDVVTVRKKQSGESVQNATTVGAWTTNPLGVPGGSRAQQTTMLVTVDAIDEANGTVTVKAADGTNQTVKAKNPENLKQLKVGDELVIVEYRAIAISLRKQSGAS